MPSQVNDVFSVIEANGFDRQDIENDPYQPVFRFKNFDLFRFTVNDASSNGAIWQVSFSPGAHLASETENVDRWAGVLTAVAAWLRQCKREISAIDRSAQAEAAPEWAVAELPPDYAKIVQDIETLQERQRRMLRMTGLFWQNGEPLNKIVRDAFRAFGFPAELTTAGATYDIDVGVGAGRLLLEVTGIEGQITKASKKIAQVLTVRTTIAHRTIALASW